MPRLITLLFLDSMVKLRLSEEEDPRGPESTPSSRWPLGVKVQILGSGGSRTEGDQYFTQTHTCIHILKYVYTVGRDFAKSAQSWNYYKFNCPEVHLICRKQKEASQEKHILKLRKTEKCQAHESLWEVFYIFRKSQMFESLKNQDVS